MCSTNFSREFRRLAATAAIAFAASAALASRPASAGTTTVDFSSTPSLKGLASFTGSATLDGDLLTVQVTNTSSRGFLYGLAFDIEQGKADYEKNDGKGGFKSVAGKHGLLVKPFGRYEDALRVRTNNRALAAGATRTLLFQVSGDSADATAYDLLNNPKGESIVAQFRNLGHGKRDKAGGAVVLRTAAPDEGSLLFVPLDPSTVTGLPTNDAPGILPPILNSPDPGTKSTGTPGAGGLTGGTSGTGKNPAPAAVALPPAAWTGFGTLALMAGVNLKRRFGRILA